MKRLKKQEQKIISLCGHDCIPWDLTYYKIAQMMKEDCKDTVEEVRVYDNIKGGISGGTIDTATSLFGGAYEAKRYAMDPYQRKPDGSKSTNKSKNVSSQLIGQTHEGDLGNKKKWSVPFFMSGVNAEVVKRSHALFENKEGQKMTYNESNVVENFPTAFVTWFGMLAGSTALLNPITGNTLKLFLPKPGEGPTEKQLKHGYLLVSGVGEGTNGSKVETELYFPSDPGYKDTARMVAESGLCLAFDTDKIPVQGGGFFSPSIGMGDALLERLCRTGSKFASQVVNGKSELRSKL